MKKFLFFFFLSFFLISTVFAVEMGENWDMFVSNELTFTHNDIWGPGAVNSFLNEGNRGWHYQNRFDFLNRWQRDEVIYEADIDTLFTNDESIDIEDVSPKRIYFKRQSPDSMFNVGDFFGNLTQYSLNQSLKGAVFELEKSPTRDWGLVALSGYAKSRWEHVWCDKDAENKDTWHHGLRFSKDIGKLKMNFTYVFTDDSRLDDTAGNSTRSTLAISHNHLGSFNWDWRPSREWMFLGESAIARDHSTTNADIDVGRAHRLRARYRTRDMRAEAEYERVPEDFHTPGGTASNDRERYRLRGYYYWGDWEFFSSYTTYWNNIGDTVGDTTKIKMPEVGTTVRNIWGRQTLSSTMRLKQRRRHTSSNSMDERTNTVFLSLSDIFMGSLRTTGEYEYRRFSPRKDASDSGERTHSVGLRFDSSYNTESINLRPFVSFRYEATKDCGPAGGYGINKDWIWSGGLGGSFKRNLDFNVAYTFTEADNYSLDSDARRRVFRCFADYKIGGSRDNTLRVEYRDRRNAFSTNTSNYNENMWIFKWIRRM